MRQLQRSLTPRVLLVVALIAATIYSAFPFYWLLVSSLTERSQLFTGALVPNAWTLDNFVDLFATTPILTWMG
ncbi:MAG: hypothetical protein ABWX92_05990, partial [Mycetocola sp.]